MLLLALLLLWLAFAVGLLIGRASCAGTGWRYVDAAIAWWQLHVTHRLEALHLSEVGKILSGQVLWPPAQLGPPAETAAIASGAVLASSLGARRLRRALRDQ